MSVIAVATSSARLQQADTVFAKAIQLHQSGQTDAALTLCKQAIELNPKHTDALHIAGVLHLHKGDAQTAVDLITRCIKIDRGNASAHANRGAACQALGQLDLAMLNFNKAIELNPKLDTAWNNRANLLMRLERNQDAIADLQQALSISPSSFEAHNNLGNALSRLGRYREAAQSHARAVQINPGHAAARWNLGMCLLRLGDFEQGWPHAEARTDHWRALGWQARGGQALTPETDLAGKSVLIYREQGLGDTLQFSRFTRMVHDRGAQVILEVQPELLDLIKRACPFAEVVPTGSDLPTFTHSCPMLSLPWVLGIQPNQIPPPTPGVAASANEVDAWRSKLGDRRKPRVGIVWSGNIGHIDDAQRSIPLKSLASIMFEGVEWISLHKEVRQADQPELAALPELRSFNDQLNGFSDTAALIEQLDLVVCVDSSVAHLAGTLGKETWLLLPFNADWRWLIDRCDTPWYPTMTLWRQAERGNWAEVLTRVKVALRSKLST